MNITVYLGANEGNDPALKTAVQELGSWIGESCFKDTFDMTSAISSSVPVPPGKARKASPSSIIFAFRSAMVGVT